MMFLVWFAAGFLLATVVGVAVLWIRSRRLLLLLGRLERHAAACLAMAKQESADAATARSAAYALQEERNQWCAKWHTANAEAGAAQSMLVDAIHAHRRVLYQHNLPVPKLGALESVLDGVAQSGTDEPAKTAAEGT